MKEREEKGREGVGESMKTDEKGSHRRSADYRRENIGVKGTEEMVQGLKDERNWKGPEGKALEK